MKASDLRLGNWIIGKEPYAREIKPFQVKTISANGINCARDNKQGDAYAEELSGIPLTPEWLERLGFEKGNKVRLNDYDVYTPFKITGNWANKDVYYELRICGSSYGLVSPFEFHRCTKNSPNSDRIFGSSPYESFNVYQLQNLYHALTGEELTIK